MFFQKIFKGINLGEHFLNETRPQKKCAKSLFHNFSTESEGTVF